MLTSKNRHAVHFHPFSTSVNWKFAPSRVRICRFCPCSVANRINLFILSLVRFGRLMRGGGGDAERDPRICTCFSVSFSKLLPPGPHPPGRTDVDGAVKPPRRISPLHSNSRLTLERGCNLRV